MKKALILYYSYEGSTKKLAEYLAGELKIDVEKVTPVKELHSKGFSKYIWGGAQVTMKLAPKLIPIKSNLDQYDLILVGSPIWAGTFAPPIYSLFKNGLIRDKKVGYFYSHGGGATGSSEKAQEVISENNTYISGFSCPFVERDYETIKLELLEWAKNIIKNS